jgi:hypothetical protein
MEKRYYTKSVNSEILKEMFLLNADIWPKIFAINVQGLESDETPKEDNIEIMFKEVPTSAELDIVAEIINDYGSGHELHIRYGLETNVMVPAMQFGQTILAKFAANNLYRGKTDEQVDSLITDYPELIHGLVTGSLTASFREFATLETRMLPPNNEVIPAFDLAEIQEFKRRIGLYLGVTQ